MAIEIVKRGNPDTDWRYEATCRRCKSVLRYKRADLKHDQREGSWIVCPVCPMGTYVEHTEANRIEVG